MHSKLPSWSHQQTPNGSSCMVELINLTASRNWSIHTSPDLPSTFVLKDLVSDFVVRYSCAWMIFSDMYSIINWISWIRNLLMSSSWTLLVHIYPTSRSARNLKFSDGMFPAYSFIRENEHWRLCIKSIKSVGTTVNNWIFWGGCFDSKVPLTPSCTKGLTKLETIISWESFGPKGVSLS